MDSFPGTKKGVVAKRVQQQDMSRSIGMKTSLFAGLWRAVDGPLSGQVNRQDSTWHTEPLTSTLNRKILKTSPCKLHLIRNHWFLARLSWHAVKESLREILPQVVFVLYSWLSYTVFYMRMFALASANCTLTHISHCQFVLFALLCQWRYLDILIDAGLIMPRQERAGYRSRTKLKSGQLLLIMPQARSEPGKPSEYASG